MEVTDFAQRVVVSLWGARASPDRMGAFGGGRRMARQPNSATRDEKETKEKQKDKRRRKRGGWGISGNKTLEPGWLAVLTTRTFRVIAREPEKWGPIFGASERKARMRQTCGWAASPAFGYCFSGHPTTGIQQKWRGELWNLVTSPPRAPSAP